MKHVHLFLLLGGLILSGSGVNAQNRAAWMKDAKFGVMTHYQATWLAKVNNLQPISVEEWNKLVNNFDVEALSKQLESVGAAYYLITVGHSGNYYIAPNEMFDHYTGIEPSKCSKRDLVSDLYTALSKRNIKLMVYLGSGPPSRDPREKKGFAIDENDPRRREAQIRWQEVIRDWSIRWGDKVVGWWFDGVYRASTMYRLPDAPNFATFAAAARAGNPSSALAFNPGVFPRLSPFTPYEDYTAGEINDPSGVDPRRHKDGMVDGTQIQVLSFLGQTWGMGDPRFTTDRIVEWSKKIVGYGGAITWDTPAQLNGTFSQPYLDQLTAVGKALGRR